MTIWLSDDDDRVLLRLEAETDLGPLRARADLLRATDGRAAVEHAPQLPGIETR